MEVVVGRLGAVEIAAAEIAISPTAASDGDLLGDVRAARRVAPVLRRGGVDPLPVIRAAAAIRPAGPQGEKIPDFLRERRLAGRQPVRIADDRGLAVPLQPHFRVESGLVEIFIKPGDCGRTAADAAMGEEEEFQVDFHALLAHFADGLGDFHPTLLIGFRLAVGVVEGEDIHTGGGQQHDVAADDPLVVGGVIARFRLAPIP